MTARATHPAAGFPPVIVTPRLILRPFRLADFEAFTALHASPHARLMWALTREAAWDRMLALAGEWTVRGFGMWALEERASGAFFGHVGFFQALDADEPELGWAVTTAAEGRGFAFEAAAAARAHGAAHLGIRRAVSNIDERNARSIRLAARLGARLERRIDYAPDAVCLVYRHPAPEDRT